MTIGVWLAVILAVIGWIGFIVRLAYGGGGKVASVNEQFKAVNGRIDGVRTGLEKLEVKTDHMGDNIQELLLSVGILQGEVKRINGRGGHANG